MDWDDEFDNGYEDIDDASQRGGSIPDKSADSSFDLMNIANPVSTYFLLSDDVQDEISGVVRKRMKCLSCGHSFKGEIYDICPKCYGSYTEEVVSGMDGEKEVTGSANMKCLDCHHKFVGETFDCCSECWSTNTEELEEENSDMWCDENF